MMKTLIPIADLLSWTEGTAQGELPVSCTGVTQDTRILQPGNLYLALRGERLDGHDFVRAALDKGAAAAMVAADWQIPETLSHAPLIRVADPYQALSIAAKAWRQASSARIIGLTGSVGKTTTKELTAALLAAQGASVRATQGNLNNAIGLPLSLLTLTRETDFGVFETGTNHPGEIRALAEILQPDVAILTNIGTAHIEHFGSQAAIAEEKGTLLESLPATGFAVLPMEAKFFDALAIRTRARVITVSLETETADYVGRCLDPLTGLTLIRERGTGVEVRLCSGLPGAHNALNLLLAYATARECGVCAEAFSPVLEHFHLPGMRWQVQEREGVTYINDAYNANAQSMVAAIQTFAKVVNPGRKILLLGDMLELGSFSEALHREVGVAVANAVPDLLLTVGDLSRQYMATAASESGFPAERIHSFADAAEAGTFLRGKLQPGDAVLLKASRGLSLEKAMDVLDFSPPMVK